MRYRVQTGLFGGLIVGLGLLLGACDFGSQPTPVVIVITATAAPTTAAPTTAPATTAAPTTAPATTAAPTTAAPTTAPATTAAPTKVPSTTAPAATTAGDISAPNAPADGTTAPDATTAPADSTTPDAPAAPAGPAACLNVPMSKNEPGTIKVPGVGLTTDSGIDAVHFDITGDTSNNFIAVFGDKAGVDGGDLEGFTGSPTKEMQYFDKDIKNYPGWTSVLNQLNAPGTGGKRLISLYSDGTTDYMVTIDPAATFLATYGKLFTDADRATAAPQLKKAQWVFGSYYGKGIAQAICTGKLPSFITPGKASSTTGSAG